MSYSDTSPNASGIPSSRPTKSPRPSDNSAPVWIVRRRSPRPVAQRELFAQLFPPGHPLHRNAAGQPRGLGHDPPRRRRPVSRTTLSPGPDRPGGGRGPHAGGSRSPPSRKPLATGVPLPFRPSRDPPCPSWHVRFATHDRSTRKVRGHRDAGRQRHHPGQPRLLRRLSGQSDLGRRRTEQPPHEVAPAGRGHDVRRVQLLPPGARGTTVGRLPADGPRHGGASHRGGRRRKPTGCGRTE